MAKRVGVIGIVVEDPELLSQRVNAIIKAHAFMVLGRMGIPRHADRVGLIALIIEGTTDEVGALTGRLGAIPGVVVKSALTTKELTSQLENGSDVNDR